MFPTTVPVNGLGTSDAILRVLKTAQCIGEWAGG